MGWGYNTRWQPFKMVPGEKKGEEERVSEERERERDRVREKRERERREK